MLETDIQWADTDQDEMLRSFRSARPAPSCPATFDNNLSDWFGTVRARAGVAFDRVLVYATGGLAYTDDNTGWVVGGGVEWALPVNWFGSSAVTFGLEGLWVSVDRDDDNNFAAPSAPSRRLAERPSMLFAVHAEQRERILRRARQAELQVRHLLSPHDTTHEKARITPGLFIGFVANCSCQSFS